MNSRERVYRAISFEEPDRIPNGCYALPGAVWKYGDKISRLFKKYPTDFSSYSFPIDDESANYIYGIHIDRWGTVWRNSKEGILGQPVGFPLENLDKLDEYSFPDPLEGFNEMLKDINNDPHEKYIIIGIPHTIFEKLQELRGFSNALADIIRESKKFYLLLDRLKKLRVEQLKIACEIDKVDGIMLADDWGTTDRLMIRPEKWRKIFKPIYRELFHVIKKHGKHALLHSDGMIMDIIPDLIEIGLDGLNFQTNINDIGMFREKFAGKLTVFADLDRVRILPFGTPREVEEHVKEVIEVLGKGLKGGLIMCGEIGPDVPPINAETMLKTIFIHGKYPIN